MLRRPGWLAFEVSSASKAALAGSLASAVPQLLCWAISRTGNATDGELELVVTACCTCLAMRFGYALAAIHTHPVPGIDQSLPVRHISTQRTDLAFSVAFYAATVCLYLVGLTPKPLRPAGYADVSFASHRLSKQLLGQVVVSQIASLHLTPIVYLTALNSVIVSTVGDQVGRVTKGRLVRLAVAILHFGISLSTAIACGVPHAQLNSPNGSTLKLWCRLVIYFSLGIALPLGVFRTQRLRPGAAYAHTLRWLAIVWTAFIFGSVWVEQNGDNMPAATVVGALATASACAPIICTARTALVSSAHTHHLTKLQRTVRELQQHLASWASATRGRGEHSEVAACPPGILLAAADTAFAASLAEHALGASQGATLQLKFAINEHWSCFQLMHPSTATEAFTVSSARNVATAQTLRAVHSGAIAMLAEAFGQRYFTPLGHAIPVSVLLGRTAPVSSSEGPSVRTEAAAARSCQCGSCACTQPKHVECTTRQRLLSRPCNLRALWVLLGIACALATGLGTHSLSRPGNYSLEAAAQHSSTIVPFIILYACRFGALLSALRLLHTKWEISFFSYTQRWLMANSSKALGIHGQPIEASLDAFNVVLIALQRLGLFGTLPIDASSEVFAIISLPFLAPYLLLFSLHVLELGHTLHATAAITLCQWCTVRLVFACNALLMPPMLTLCACAATTTSAVNTQLLFALTVLCFSALLLNSIYLALVSIRHSKRSVREMRPAAREQLWQVRETIVIRTPEFTAVASIIMSTLVVGLALVSFGTAVAVTLPFVVLNLMALFARGTLLNHCAAFEIATTTDCIEQHTKRALGRVLQACAYILGDPEKCSFEQEAANQLKELSGDIFLQFVANSRPDMYSIPITVAAVVDSLLEALAEEWTAGGVEVVLDRRRVDFPAALMQELQVHPGPFLGAVCEAINRVATDILMYKGEADAPLLSVTPFLRVAGPSKAAVLRVAVSQRIRGTTSKDQEAFSMQASNWPSDRHRWGAFLSRAKHLRAECNEGAWLAGTPCKFTADHSQMGGVYTISVDTPISRACHLHISRTSLADVRALRLQTQPPAHSECVCQLLAPADLKIGEAHESHGLVRCALYQNSVFEAASNWRCCVRDGAATRTERTTSCSAGKTVAVGSSGPGQALTAAISKLALGAARVYSASSAARDNSGGVASAGNLSLEYMWAERTDSTQTSDTISQLDAGNASQLYTMRSLPSTMLRFASVNEDDEATDSGCVTSSCSAASLPIGVGAVAAMSGAEDTVQGTLADTLTAVSGVHSVVAPPGPASGSPPLALKAAGSIATSPPVFGRRWSSSSASRHVVSTEGATSWTLEGAAEGLEPSPREGAAAHVAAAAAAAAAAAGSQS